MEAVSIFSDFNNADPSGRLRLNLEGTTSALKAHNMDLREGVVFLLTDGEEAQTEGVATYSSEERIWVEVINWNNLERG